MSSAWSNVLVAGAGLPAPAEVGIAARVVGSDRAWSHHGEQVFAAASTVKLAILVALARALDAGRLELSDRRVLHADAIVQGSGVLLGMQPGLSLPLADYAYLMIAVSDNTASNELIDAVGLDQVQATIASLHLVDLALNRRFLGRRPDPGEPENVSSARDLITLLAAIAGDTAASPERCAWMRRLLGQQQHRDRLARCLPPGISFAGKSGTMPELAHDAGLLTGSGGTLAIAVLTSGIADPYAADDLIGRIGRAMAAEIA